MSAESNATSEPQFQAGNNTIGEMTRDELKELMREVVQEFIWELEQYLPDSDTGLTLKPEIAERLLKLQDEKETPLLHSLQDVLNALDLDECSV